MSRWLLNYTPSATLVRLFALNAVNVYSVAGIMRLARVTEEPSRLLPSWILVATVSSFEQVKLSETDIPI